MKRQVIIWLVFFNLVIGGIVVWLYQQTKLPQANQAAQTAPVFAYPSYPQETETYLDEAKTWQIKSFQPIFKEMIEAESKRFLVVTAGAETVKIFVGSQIPYIDENANKTIIDSLELKNLLKPEDQFGINYLSAVPEDFSLEMPHCQKQRIECLLAWFKQESDAKGEKIFYPLMVYRILKP